MSSSKSLIAAAAWALFALPVLSACTTLYSKERELKLPANLGAYVVSAQINAGLFTREAVISVNGREVLRGQSFIWSDTIDMSGAIDKIPIDASCHRSERSCDVRIAGMLKTTLRF